MSETQPEGTTVEHADNVNVEAPAADTGSGAQDGGDGGQEQSGGLVAEDSKVEQASADSAE